MQHRYFLFLLTAITIIGGCKKKMDITYDDRPVTGSIVSSNTRLIDLASERELQIGDVKLTSFMKPNYEGYYGTAGTMRVTKYFPKNGQLTSTYDIPTEFIGTDGYIRNLQVSNLSTRDYAPPPRPFTLQDHGRTPMDYYHIFYKPNAGGYMDSLFAVPRDVSPSSDPQKFRIRLVNLGSTPDNYGRSGAFTLAWSDGTPVDGRTSNIASNSLSEYIEIPYGSYQFKVLAPDGREVPMKVPGGAPFGVLNPNTGTLEGYGVGQPGVGKFNETWLSFAQLKTYQPGGVYTIVVAAMGGYSQAIPGSNSEATSVQPNCFQLISDAKEPVNYTYARIQGVNTIPGEELTWKVDNGTLGTTTYANHTDYGIFITGTYHVTATDQKGATIADEQIALQPGDNITAWAYTKNDGKGGIGFSTNNLSGVYSIPVTGNDGSYSTITDVYPCWIRFMNFCPDVPEATFTSNNGAALQNSTAGQHVFYGVQKTTDVYQRQQINFSSDILAYASQEKVLPGYWLSAVDPLKSSAFISDISLYKTPGKPDSEPGIFTVALIGSLKGGATEKAKMIVIKHNR